LHETFVFFKRSFNPVHVIAVSIGHRDYDREIAMSLRAKKQIRNPGHYFTNAESAHRLPIEFERGTNVKANVPTASRFCREERIPTRH
jgi:hypothetical protein